MYKIKLAYWRQSLPDNLVSDQGGHRVLDFQTVGPQEEDMEQISK